MIVSMAGLLNDVPAESFLALDKAGAASLTEIAAAIGRPLSSVQRSMAKLVESGVVQRDGPRGRFEFTAGAPRDSLRAIATWSLAAGLPPDTGLDVAVPVPRTLRAQVTVRQNLASAIKAIVDAVHPVRILLFGSQARGDARPDSDVDFLDVVDAGTDRRTTRIEARRALASMPFAKDVLVASPDDLARPAAGTSGRISPVGVSTRLSSSHDEAGRHFDRADHSLAYHASGSSALVSAPPSPSGGASSCPTCDPRRRT